MSKLYNLTAVNIVIGCLYNNPSLYFNDKYRLSLDDFYNSSQKRGYRFQRILFGAGRKLAEQGVQEITEVDVGEFVSGYRENMAILEENDYLEAIPTFKQFGKENSFDYYYNRVRKLSLLARAKYDKGCNIDKFFNEDNAEDEQFTKLDKYSIFDIINEYELMACDLKQEYYLNENNEYYKAGKDFEDTIESIKSNQLLGSSFQSMLLNELFNGQLGFHITAAKSGDGKSIISLGNMCNVSSKYLYNEDTKRFEKNRHFDGGSLFINTELSLRNEVDIACIAYISNVDRGKIRRWNLTKEEENRVVQAGEILKDSPIYLVDDAEFTTKSLENEIKDHVIKYNVKNVFFDYIANNGYVSKEISSEQSIPTREDIVLLTLTSRLKDIQNKYGIYLHAGIQCNSQIDTLPYPTEAVLAGGGSSVRKTDGTMVIKAITKNEQKTFDECCYRNEKGFREKLKPNRTIHIVKGRNTMYEKYSKILVHIDFGTGKITDFIALNKNDEPINVSRLDIVGDINEED